MSAGRHNEHVHVFSWTNSLTDPVPARIAHSVEGGYVIAEDGMRLPGLYADLTAAKLAFEQSHERLQQLNYRISHVQGANRPITFADILSHTRETLPSERET